MTAAKELIEVFRVVDAAEENEYPTREEPDVKEFTTPNDELAAVDAVKVAEVELISAATEDRSPGSEFDDVETPEA